MSDDVMRCGDCGELFLFLARGVCGECLQARDEAFWKAREWFRANRGASVTAAAGALDISPGMINEWVREGRLTLKADINPDDVDLAKVLAEKQRTDELRKAFAEAAATRPAPAQKAKPPTRPHHGLGGMHGRRNHDA